MPHYKVQVVESPVHEPDPDAWAGVVAGDELAAAKAALLAHPDRAKIIHRPEIYVCVWKEGDAAYDDGQPREGTLITLTLPHNQN